MKAQKKLHIAYSSLYAHPLPEGHRFPMAKYELIPEQLLYEGTIHTENLFLPNLVEEEAILRVHELEYWQKLKMLSLTPAEIRRTGFPLSAELVERERSIMGAAIACADYALANGVAINIAGGTHHAFAEHGEGFCLLNDFAISSAYLLEKGLASKILILDLDVHQGNGTAAIFTEEERVFTFSMHCGANYPLHKERSDRDIELPIGCEDAQYLEILNRELPRVLEEFQPDFVCYLSGVDILATDKLGRLGMTQAGCKMRDKMVLSTLKAANLPVSIAMGGGYSHHIKDIVEAHCNTYRLAQEIWF